MSRRVRVAFTTLFLLLIGTAAVSYWNVRTLTQAAAQVVHSHEALTQMVDLLSTLQDVETGERGYLITGNPVYLDPYRAARADADHRFDRLRTFITDSAEQERLLSEVQDLANVEFREVDEAIRIRAEQGFLPAAQEVVRGTGKAAMNAIRSTIAQMQANEKDVLARRNQRTHEAAFVASATFSVAAFLAAGLLIILRRLLRAQLTERERTTAELERLNRAKDAFLATLSHELRSPLSPIIMWSRTLRSRPLDPEQTQRALEVIERSAMAQVRLVDDLLDVSRINAGTMRLDTHPVAFAPVIERALDMVRPAAEAKTIAIQSTLDAQATEVLGDADRLQQVVWNLLTNAVKFTPDGGRIEVTLQRAGSDVELRVRDSGQGIPHAFLPRVFDRFAQADGSTTRAHGGLGLGLAIVQHIVQLLGGRVDADSPGEGQGATFRVRLPALPSAAAGTTADASAGLAALDHPLPSLAGVRVLIVDDDAASNEVTQVLLSSCGAVVQTVGSASQALELLQRWRPQVLISDIGMPGQDGYELLAKVRGSARNGAQLPAIAWTGFASEQDRERLLAAGFQIHVPKAADPAELVAAVAGLAEHSHPGG